jgi:hypothetical protein
MITTKHKERFIKSEPTIAVAVPKLKLSEE